MRVDKIDKLKELLIDKTIEYIALVKKNNQEARELNIEMNLIKETLNAVAQSMEMVNDRLKASVINPNVCDHTFKPVGNYITRHRECALCGFKAPY